MFQEFKYVPNRSKPCDVQKSNNGVFKIDNIAKIEKTGTNIAKSKNEILKPSVSDEPVTTQSIAKELVLNYLIIYCSSSQPNLTPNCSTFE